MKKESCENCEHFDGIDNPCGIGYKVKLPKSYRCMSYKYKEEEETVMYIESCFVCHHFNDDYNTKCLGDMMPKQNGVCDKFEDMRDHAISKDDDEEEICKTCYFFETDVSSGSGQPLNFGDCILDGTSVQNDYACGKWQHKDEEVDEMMFEECETCDDCKFYIDDINFSERRCLLGVVDSDDDMAGCVLWEEEGSKREYDTCFSCYFMKFKGIETRCGHPSNLAFHSVQKSMSCNKHIDKKTVEVAKKSELGNTTIDDYEDHGARLLCIFVYRGYIIIDVPIPGHRKIDKDTISRETSAMALKESELCISQEAATELRTLAVKSPDNDPFPDLFISEKVITWRGNLKSVRKLNGMCVSMEKTFPYTPINNRLAPKKAKDFIDSLIEKSYKEDQEDDVNMIAGPDGNLYLVENMDD